MQFCHFVHHAHCSCTLSIMDSSVAFIHSLPTLVWAVLMRTVTAQHCHYRVEPKNNAPQKRIMRMHASATLGVGWGANQGVLVPGGCPGAGVFLDALIQINYLLLGENFGHIRNVCGQERHANKAHQPLILHVFSFPRIFAAPAPRFSFVKRRWRSWRSLRSALRTFYGRGYGGQDSHSKKHTNLICGHH